MSKMPKRLPDANQLTKYIVELATTEMPQKSDRRRRYQEEKMGFLDGKARSEAFDA
jgi:hypothetical protein